MQKNFNLFITTIGCIIILFLTTKNVSAQNLSSQKTLWQIGKADHSDAEFAMAPSGYKDFVGKDFGWENKFYLVGFSDPKKDWPYALPGPEDAWGGSSGGAGYRAAVENILFGIDKLPQQGSYELIIDLLDMSAGKPPLFKVTVNDTSWEYQLPKGSGDNTLKGQQTNYSGHIIKISIPTDVITQI